MVISNNDSKKLCDILTDNCLVEKFKLSDFYNKEDTYFDMINFLSNEGLVIKIANNGLDKTSVVNGPGIRYTIFTQGCDHKCPGCHNPETHNYYNGNYVYIFDLINDINKYKNIIRGITLTGGDPLFSRNFNSTIKLCKLIKEMLNKEIWIYTGYEWDEIINSDLKKITNWCDVIVTGRFVSSLQSYNLKYYGSSNQKLIDVKESLKNNSQIELKI